MRSCASRTPHEAELLFGLITQRRAGGQRAASTGAPRRNTAQGPVGTPRAAASSLVRCLSSDRQRQIGEAPIYGGTDGRRDGKKGVRTSSSRWSTYHYTKQKYTTKPTS